MRRYFIWLSFTLAVCFLMNGFYMLAKAHLAQALLTSTWQKILTQDSSRLSKPWPWADFYPVAKLTFLPFGLSQVVLNKDSGQALAFGPALTGTNTTNINGVIIISGHNDSHFKVLEALKIGDEMLLEDNQAKGRYYRVADTQIIDTRTSQLSINDNGQGLVLVTCYPFGGMVSSSPYRFIVLAKPIDYL